MKGDDGSAISHGSDTEGDKGNFLVGWAKISNVIIRWSDNGTMRNDDYRGHLATRVDISWSKG